MYRDKKILLVEDEAVIAMLEKQQLESYGYVVQHVFNGENALQAIRESNDSFDLVLMDIDLGTDIDGTDVAESILDEIDIPIIFLSGHTERDIVEKTEKITSYGYVVKNSGITVLDASIKMAFKLFKSKKDIEAKENELTIKEERFRSFFNYSAVGIAQISPEGNFLEVNSKFCAIVGYTQDELKSMTFVDITHPDDFHLDDKYISEVISGNIDSFELDKRYIQKNGNEIWIRLFSNVVCNKDGSIQYAIASIVDIDDSKKAINKLEINEHKYRQIVNTSPYGIEEVDLSGKMIYLNDAYHKMLGYEPGELIGTYIWDHDPTDEQVEKLKEYFSYLIERRPEPEPYISQNKKKNGEIIDVYVDWNYMFNIDGELAGFISVVKDITDIDSEN